MKLNKKIISLEPLVLITQRALKHFMQFTHPQQSYTHSYIHFMHIFPEAVPISYLPELF